LLNIYFVKDRVLDIDTDLRRVYLTETQQPISYDILSLDIGNATKALEAMPGNFDYAIPIRPMHELEGRLEQAEAEFSIMVNGGGAGAGDTTAVLGG
jgi:NADH dehydrogenase FAD-containing subunit